MLDTQLGYLYLVSRADLLEVVMFLVELRFEQITVEEDCKVWCQRQPKWWLHLQVVTVCGHACSTQGCSAETSQSMAWEHFGCLFASPLVPFGADILLWATFLWMTDCLVRLCHQFSFWVYLHGTEEARTELEDFFQALSVGCDLIVSRVELMNLVNLILAFLTKQHISFCKSWAWIWCQWNFWFTGIISMFLWKAVERRGWERVDPGWLNLIRSQISLFAGRLQQTEFLCWTEADFQTSWMLEFLRTLLLINLQ